MESKPPYDEVKAVNQTLLKEFMRSPYHFKLMWNGILKREPTPALGFGHVVHMAVFEPMRFDSSYAPLDEATDLRTKAGKEARQAIIDSGKSPIKPQEYEAALRIRDEAFKHPMLMSMLGDGTTETEWYNQVNDVACKGRTDWHHPSVGILDLKTCEDASPHEFAKDVWQYKYYIQAGMYTLLTGLDRFYFVAAEKKPPYLVVVYQLNEEYLIYGQSKVRDLLTRIKKCFEHNDWPRYEYWQDNQNILTLNPPAWAQI
jgi:exodeoxyribonuclease VIII